MLYGSSPKTTTKMQIAIICYQSLMCLFAFITLFRVDHWMVRLFDFPKVQLLFLSLLGLFMGLLFFDFDNVYQWIGIVMISLAILFHSKKILPYSFLYKKEVIRSIPKDSSRSISLLQVMYSLQIRIMKNCYSA